jgi:glucosamine-6-phosphate deaminase
MPIAPLRTFSSPSSLGDKLAESLLSDIENARASGARFLLGCPTGRTPRPIFEAMARQLAEKPRDISHLVLVMMDEYLVPDGDGLRHAPATEPWSCHYFARVEIAARLNASLPKAQQLRDAAILFPDPHDPSAYDEQIDALGGIDFFLLASGASDGHVAFNPPGSPRESRTRIIRLSEETRRDNLQTFPTFGSLDVVPNHGISVGVDTIARSRKAVMVVWGAGKRLTLARMIAATRYEADWPATLIHECPSGEIWSDAEAATLDMQSRRAIDR